MSPRVRWTAGSRAGAGVEPSSAVAPGRAEIEMQVEQDRLARRADGQPRLARKRHQLQHRAEGDAGERHHHAADVGPRAMPAGHHPRGDTHDGAAGDEWPPRPRIDGAEGQCAPGDEEPGGDEQQSWHQVSGRTAPRRSNTAGVCGRPPSRRSSTRRAGGWRSSERIRSRCWLKRAVLLHDRHHAVGAREIEERVDVDVRKALAQHAQPQLRLAARLRAAPSMRSRKASAPRRATGRPAARGSSTSPAIRALSRL